MSDKTYKIEFIWRKTSSTQGRLDAVRCNSTDVPKDEYTHGVANDYVQYETHEQNNACLSVNKPQVVRQDKGRFVYLDVGGWVDGKQTFGLIWGNQACLCTFTAGVPASSLGTGTGNLLEEFLRLPGVNKVKQLWIDGPCNLDWNMIHVIVPDTHVPACPPLSFARPPDKPANQFWHWYDDGKIYDSWCERDIFKSRKSIDAMTAFLRMLVSVKFAKQIQFTQVGDMYELWMKRDCMYTAKPTGAPGVALQGRNPGPTVGEWICDTHDFYPDLFMAYDDCVAKLKQANFIHGNHDDYLSVPEVIAQANSQISARCSTATSLWPGKYMQKSTVHARTASGNVFDQGIFIEHGQRCDGNNNDGNNDGWRFTQSGTGAMAWIGDSTRRPSFVTAAAALWVSRSRDFGCYIMGHTHSADLNYVEVTHSLEQYHVGPERAGVTIRARL